MNKIKGIFGYKGTTCWQHPKVGDKLEILFKKTKPMQILEIGTANGGLTELIRDLLDKLSLFDTALRTYDVNPDHIRTRLLDRIEQGANIDFRLKNLFNYPYSEIVEVEEVTDFIHRPGTTIVMCDGGSKKNEFRMFAPLLKRGDIIMAHDYAPNKEYFEKNIRNKIWNWHEIEDEHINDSCNEYHLEPFLQDELLEVVWACRIKSSDDS